MATSPTTTSSTPSDSGHLRCADGTSLYWEALDAAAPTATIMLLHGLGEHIGRYGHLIAALTEANYSVVAVDHRGHGRSSGKRAVVNSYDEFMDDLYAFHREVVEPRLDGRSLVVLGHSMGGNLAMGYTLRYPEGIDGLALSGPLLAPGDDVNAFSRRIVHLVARLSPSIGLQKLGADSISRDPNVVQAYENDPLVYHGKVSAGIGSALLRELETFPDRYRELRVPVLVMHGTDDRLTTPDGSRQLERGATDTTVTAHFYDGFYHEIFNEPERERPISDLIAWLDANFAT